MHTIKGISCPKPKIETEKSSNIPQKICKSKNIDISTQINSNDCNSSTCDQLNSTTAIYSPRTKFESWLKLIKDKMTNQLNNPTDIEELLDEPFFSSEYIITPSFCESNQSLLFRLNYSHLDPATNKQEYFEEFHNYYKNHDGAAIYDKINDIFTIAKSEVRIFSAEIIRQTTYFFQDKYYDILYFIIFQLFQTIDPSIVSSDSFIAKYENCAEIISENITEDHERINNLFDCQNSSDEAIDLIINFSIRKLALFFAYKVFHIYHINVDFDLVDYHENSIKYFNEYINEYQYDEFEIILTKPLVYKKIGFDSLLFILNEFKLSFSDNGIFNNYQKYSVDINISNLFDLLLFLFDNKQAFPFLRSNLYSMIKNHFMLNEFPNCSDNLISPSNENEIKKIVVEIRQILREKDPTKKLESKIEEFCNLIDTNACK